ncbi:unnamed protein product [Miscanthus lutarioriparius]|uniref:BZIP domain-containing protein n=1 Tax=Miscanthus lutarioriparius TaxID=422564 RepID=A0A811R7K5_9POAL|nr:unnamed protein product [Miscanthus lutarioriparius]
MEQKMRRERRGVATGDVVNQQAKWKAVACSRYVTSGPVGGGAMGIYERQRHLVAAGVWGEPFRPDADAVALPLPRPLAAVAPTVTVATTPAPLDVVEAEEVKFGKRLLQAQQDDVAPPVEEEAPPPPSDSFGHDDDARPRDKIQRRLAQNREAARKSRLRKKITGIENGLQFTGAFINFHVHGLIEAADAMVEPLSEAFQDITLFSPL